MLPVPSVSDAIQPSPQAKNAAPKGRAYFYHHKNNVMPAPPKAKPPQQINPSRLAKDNTVDFAHTS